MFAKSIRDSLERTRNQVFGRIATFMGQADVTEATFDELEAMLIQADLGVNKNDSKRVIHIADLLARGLKK